MAPGKGRSAGYLAGKDFLMANRVIDIPRVKDRLQGLVLLAKWLKTIKKGRMWSSAVAQQLTQLKLEITIHCDILARHRQGQHIKMHRRYDEKTYERHYKLTLSNYEVGPVIPVDLVTNRRYKYLIWKTRSEEYAKLHAEI